MPLAVGVGAGILGLLGFPAPGRSQAPLELEVRTLWGLEVPANAETELFVRLGSAQGGPVTVHVGGPGLAVATRVELEGGRSARTVIPVRAGRGRLEVRAAGEEHAEVRAELPVRPREGRAPVLVIGSVPAFAASPAPVALLYPAASDLPTNPAAYDAVGGVVVGGSALGGLEPGQAEALGGFLAGCGSVLAVGVSPAVEHSLRARAGCGGAQFRVATAGDDLGAALDALLARWPDRLPGDGSLRTLLPRRPWAVLQVRLACLLAVYFLFLALALVRRWGPVALAVVSVGAAASVAGLAFATGPVVDAAVWAELDSGARAARYAGVVRLGPGRGQQGSLAWVPPLSLPRTPSAAPLALTRRDGGPGTWDLSFPLRPFAAEELFFGGVHPVPAPLRVTWLAGEPSVEAQGAGPSPAGWLARNGQLYPVPALGPGERWAPAASAPVPLGADPAQRLLLERTGRGGAAVLVPFPADWVPGGTAGRPASGWLLVRAPGGEGEDGR